MQIRQDGEWCEIDLTYGSSESYAAFIKAKTLPQFTCLGRTIRFLARYMHVIGGIHKTENDIEYNPIDGLFDYQSAIVRMALKLGRRFYGTEIKDEYFRTAMKNLAAASKIEEPQTLLFA